MRRLLLALVGTAAGLAAVLSFKTQGSAATSGAVAAPETGTQGSASAPATTGNAGTTSGSAGTTSGSAASKSSGGAAAPAGGGTAGAAGAKVLTGDVVNTSYGPMQVQVTLQGKKITGVKVLQETNTGSLSQQIDANAVPQLTKETLAAQSARIDAVSGASYTSSGYIKSLQSALDKATA